MTNERWNFGQCLEELRRFSEERAWQPFHDPKNLAMLLSSEAGELLAELRWVENGSADDYAKQEAVSSRIKQELADVMIAVLLMAERIDVDLRVAVLQKIETNRANYPADASIGVAYRTGSE